MNKAYFAMGLHFHQPVGNFPEILERAYLNCYNPFLDVFSKYPGIKMTFHFSGNLLDYFEEKHADFLDRVRALVDAGRVEIMGGGYYEPIFQAIPQEDRLGQIEMMSAYCKKKFGVRPRGMWIPERVWSPGLIGDFTRCGIEYSILDDAHLLRAGIGKDEFCNYFTAGYAGNKIAIFPTTKILRYSIPFKPPRWLMNYFRKTSKDGKGVLFTYGDDAEKFGEWPWTHDWVYKKGWLNNFFKELVKNQGWLETVCFSEYLDLHRPLKEVKIPEASYEEMMEWSGGSWMNFLSKYPESDQMHKRMMHVSNRINSIKSQIPSTPVPQGYGAGKSQKEIEDARKELYKAQTNCAYWHGVFGGIYLFHLRRDIYRHLIEADKIVSGDNDEANIKKADFYNKCSDAVIFEDKNFFICLDPERGGIIRELDYKPESVNLINTLAKHREDYHKKILERINNNNITEPLKIHEAIKAIDERIRKGIFYDRHMRACLIDHFIDKDLKMEDFANCNYVDLGDFADAHYAAKIEKNRVRLSRSGKVEAKELLVSKEIRISSDREIEISYVLTNKSDSLIDTFFGMEFNVMMPYGDSDRYRYNPGEDFFSIKDSQGGLAAEFVFSGNVRKIWHFPVMAVSQTERSYSLSYQAYCVFPVWDAKLGSGDEMKFSIIWRMKHSLFEVKPRTLEQRTR